MTKFPFWLHCNKTSLLFYFLHFYCPIWSMNETLFDSSTSYCLHQVSLYLIKHYFGVQSTAEDPKTIIIRLFMTVSRSHITFSTSAQAHVLIATYLVEKCCTKFSTTGMHQSPAQKLHIAKWKKQPYSACRENLQQNKTDLHNCITCVSLKAANIGSSISWIKGKKNKNQSFFHFVIKQGKTKK